MGLIINQTYIKFKGTPVAEVILAKETMIVSETDERGIILFANDDFCKISGFTIEELTGKPHNMVRHQDMPKAAFRDLWETVKQNKIWNGIVKNKTKSGDFHWVNATVFQKPSKTAIRYVSVRVCPTKEAIEQAENLYKTLD